MSDGIQLPAMAPLYDKGWNPVPAPPLPTYPTGGCGHVDPVFGPCLMSEAPHGMHRTRWARGFEAWWPNRPPQPVLVAPV